MKRRANDKAQDVTVKKLTRGNPTMAAKFAALKGKGGGSRDRPPLPHVREVRRCGAALRCRYSMPWRRSGHRFRYNVILWIVELGALRCRANGGSLNALPIGKSGPTERNCAQVLEFGGDLCVQFLNIL